jgi:hypothetical protein
MWCRKFSDGSIPELSPYNTLPGNSSRHAALRREQLENNSVIPIHEDCGLDTTKTRERSIETSIMM